MVLLIMILMGFVFTAGQGMFDRARKTQAKNDVTQIVTAVNAFYTEYGQYPIVTSDTPPPSTAALFNALRGKDTTNNPRGIVFISPPDLGTASNPRSGIGSDGQYYDPWGTPYKIAIDGNYDNQITTNPYGANNGAGPEPLPQVSLRGLSAKTQSLGQNQRAIRTVTTFTQSPTI